MGSQLSRILERDSALGQAICLSAQGSKFQRLLATIISFSGDEALWMALPLVGWVAQALFRSGPAETNGFCAELLADVLTCAIIETGFKCCVRRERPQYAKQGTWYVLPGEWWSFPSGHAMRATFLVQRLLRSPTLLAALLGPRFATSSPGHSVLTALLWIWALAVGWSRAAKGKHYPADVTAGLLLGAALSECASRIGWSAWSVVRLVAGSVTCAEAAVMTVQPQLRLEGFKVLVSFQAIWFASLPVCLALPLTWPQVLCLGVPNFALFAALGPRIAKYLKP